MKLYILIAITLMLSATINANELSWVDTQVDAIKPPRQGMSDSEIATIKDPFVFYKNRTAKKYKKTKVNSKRYSGVKNSTTSSGTSDKRLEQHSKPFILSAIINDSALINGEWYKVNESVDNFTLSSISRTSVVLTKGSGKLVLTTNDTKRNLKFK
nr:hypothetical protein [uncultured Sulfurimonas sp.]